MRNLLATICFICICQWVAAQNEITVVHSSGKAQYYAPQQNTPQSIHPGLRLSLDGKVRVQSGTGVKVLYNGVTYTLKSGKLHLLRELEKKADKGTGMGFAGRFWSFLTNSLKQSQNEEVLEDNHRRYMESVHAGVSGFANKKYPIHASLLYSNNLSATAVTFRWSSVKNAPGSRFQISRETDGLVICVIHIRDSTLRLDLSQLALEPNEEYNWVILPAMETSDGPRSEEFTFLFRPEGASKVLDDLRRQPEFNNAGPAEQRLMEAFALEEAGFLYDAFEIYATASSAHPDNLLVRDSRAAFLARMDLLEEARGLLRD